MSSIVGNNPSDLSFLPRISPRIALGHLPVAQALWQELLIKLSAGNKNYMINDDSAFKGLNISGTISC